MDMTTLSAKVTNSYHLIDLQFLPSNNYNKNCNIHNRKKRHECASKSRGDKAYSVHPVQKSRGDLSLCPPYDRRPWVLAIVFMVYSAPNHRIKLCSHWHVRALVPVPTLYQGGGATLMILLITQHSVVKLKLLTYKNTRNAAENSVEHTHTHTHTYTHTHLHTHTHIYIYIYIYI